MTEMINCYLGIDIGSISTKGVIIDDEAAPSSRARICGPRATPRTGAKNVIAELGQIDTDKMKIVGAGTTGSARRLVGAMIGASRSMKNEITAHAVGTTHLHPNVRTILEIGGQDSKIICVSDGIAVDYAMNTLCAAGTGSFLSSQAHRLGVEVEEFGDRPHVEETRPTSPRAAPCSPRAISCTRSRWATRARTSSPACATLWPRTT